MKASWRRVLRAASQGKRIWAYTPGKVAFICHGDLEYSQVRTSTLEEMEQARLLKCEQKENFYTPETSHRNDRAWVLADDSE